MRHLLALMVMAVALGSGPATAGELRPATLYKTPQCGCCEATPITCVRTALQSRSSPTDDLPLLKRQYDVPGALEGCHTTLVEGYVVEGHVPVATILRLLNEKPEIKGISLPGMSAGLPGMSGEKTGPFTIFAIGEGEPKVYAVE